jgi:hypothetical protein
MPYGYLIEVFGEFRTEIYLKGQVYQHRPQTLEALKEAITQEVAAIPPEMTRRVMENYRKRLNKCSDNEDNGHTKK